LAADFPDRPEFRGELATSHNNLGTLLHSTGRPKEAEAAYGDALLLQKRLAADFPDRPEFRHQLAGTHNNLGNLLRETGRLNEAEAALEATLGILKELATDFPNQPDLRNAVAGTCVNLAILHLRQREFRRAKVALGEAVAHHESALKANPRHPTYLQFYRNNLMALIQTNAGLGDPAGAKQVARRLRDVGGGDPPGNAYDAACGLALCIPIVQLEANVTKEARDKQAQLYADAALLMLRDAVTKGWRDAAHMKKDKDLDPLRQRDDFKKLLADLEARPKGSEGKHLPPH
jgi:tetratricopeptide (TPR) repeat protein